MQMMTPAEVIEAEAEVQHSDELVEKLEAAIVAGDPSVSIEDVVEAEKAGRFARLKARAAKAKADRDAESARAARLADVEARVVATFGTHQGDVVALFDAAVAAAAPLVTAIAEHNDRLATITTELTELGPLPGNLSPAVGDGILIGDLTVEPIDAARLVSELAWRAMTTAGVDPGIDLTRAAGMSTDATLADAYGVARRDDGAVLAHGLSDRLRWLARGVTAWAR